MKKRKKVIGWQGTVVEKRKDNESVERLSEKLMPELIPE